MGAIIGVQFQKNGKLYYFDPDGFEVKVGDYVIVDTSRGQDLGEVITGSRNIDETQWNTPLKKVIRIATEQDIQHGIDNRAKEKEAFSICQKKITEHKLEMKLVSVEYAFDNSKILFFFTANGRVDFRSLVKDLASIFKMRIELRQIGVRDEAKMLGGLGPCGRQICCGSFLDQFQPVSIKMAKEQNLSLNPTKISGVCGRLMCCLKYEQDHYEQTRKKMPKVGREVSTPDGTGPVTDLNIVKETVFVRLANGDSSEIREYKLEDITRLDAPAHQESKKTVFKDKNPTQNSETVLQDDPGILLTDVEDEQTDTVLSDEKKPEQSSGRSRHRSKGQRNHQQLGQPVKRENPKRNDQGTAQKQEIDSLHDDKHTSDCQAGATAATTPWADALEKAMQAINCDNYDN